MDCSSGTPDTFGEPLGSANGEEPMIPFNASSRPGGWSSSLSLRGVYGGSIGDISSPSTHRRVFAPSGSFGSIDPMLHAHMARGSTPTPAPAPPGNAHWSNSSGSTLDDSPGPPAGCEPDAIKLFVGNIPKSCTEQQLLPLFQSVGHVVELAIMRDRETSGGSKGSAFLWYSTRAAADMAIQKFHLRYILHDPVGENSRRLVLRKAWAKGDSNLIHTGPASAGGPDAAGGGAAQLLYLSLGPNGSTANPPAGQQPPAAAGTAPAMQGKPSFTALSYQSQGPLPPDLWPRQPPAAPGLDPSLLAQPVHPRPAHLHPGSSASSPLPLPHTFMPGGLLCPPSRTLLSQLPSAALSARCSGNSWPLGAAHPPSLESATRAPRPGSDYAEYAGYAEQPASTMFNAMSASAGVHRPFSMEAALGLSSMSDAGPQRSAHAPAALGQDHGPPGLPSDAPTIAKSQMLGMQQLHSIVEYLHTVQEMCGAEVVVTMAPVPGCFQLKMSGSGPQVQAGEVIVNSLLGVAPACRWTA